jgi:molybdenum transport protein
MFITDDEIDSFIAEDVPYFDLTSHILGIGGEKGRIEYFTREDITVCGAEEVIRMFGKLGIEPEQFIPSGRQAKAGDTLLSGTGEGGQLHIVWKAGQNLLDQVSAIATRTRKMLDEGRKYNPALAILTTRKCFPGTKKLAIKAVLAGGALPHRLGLSETILIFKQHLNFIGGMEGLVQKLPGLKGECCEKKILVEAENYEDARRFCAAGADGIQFDKLPPASLQDAVSRLKGEFPAVILLAAGGVNEGNVGEYAKTGVDGIVTTSLYNVKPVDIGVRIKPV